jgi:hypothetical protein
VPSIDPLNVNRGNPDLRPTYTQSFSMDYNWSGTNGSLRVGPYFRYSTDVWERIRTVDADGIATNRWENAASSSVLGTNFTLSLPPTGKLSGSVNANVYRDERDGTNISSAYHRSAMLWSFGGNLGMKVTPTLTAQGFASYFPTQSILQGRASGYAYMSLGFRQQILDRKGSISLNVNDPLNLQRYNSSTSDATYIQTSRSNYKSRVFTLGLTYNFGKPPRQQSRRSSGPEEAGETIRVR